MKVTIDIDCSPEEARTFMGLPDLRPVQEAVLKEMQNRMQETLRAMSPDTMLKTWLPLGIQNVEQMQKLFFAQFQNLAPKPSATTKTKKTG